MKSGEILGAQSGVPRSNPSHSIHISAFALADIHDDAVLHGKRRLDGQAREVLAGCNCRWMSRIGQVFLLTRKNSRRHGRIQHRPSAKLDVVQF